MSDFSVPENEGQESGAGQEVQEETLSAINEAIEEPAIEEPQEGRRLGPLIGAGVVGLALVGIVGGVLWSNLGGGSKAKEELPFGGNASVQQPAGSAATPSVPSGAPSMPLPSAAPETSSSAVATSSASPSPQGNGAEPTLPQAAGPGQTVGQPQSSSSSVPQTSTKDIGGSSNLKATDGVSQQPVASPNSVSSDSTVQALTARVAKLEEEVSKLEGKGAGEAHGPKARAVSRVHHGKAHSEGDKTSEKNVKAVSSEKASVKAIVPGQAWINVGDRTIVVHRGDQVPGLGVVKSIDADKGIVATSGGSIK